MLSRLLEPLAAGRLSSAFVPFDEAGQLTAFADFVSGFLIDGGAATFGRPAGVTVAADGALFSATTATAACIACRTSRERSAESRTWHAGC